MSRSRLLLADDHQLFAEGVRKLLEPEFELIETVADGRAAIEAYQRLKPDAVLLDIGLPLLNGIETARQIKSIAPGARILFVTMHGDRTYVEEAFRAGGLGYVLKHGAARDLVEAIQAVLRNRYYVSPPIAERLGPPPYGGSKSQLAQTGVLTARQREVLQLVAEGKTMKEIASILRISVRTVEFHKNSIMRELGFRTTAELTRYALSHGIAVSEERAGNVP
jgi:DNA-binding NarL/FixJ family response regulator